MAMTTTISKIDKEYLNWFAEIKTKIRSTQIRAALAANATLIEFYWDLGRMIAEKQEQTVWGDKLMEQLSNDLQSEFPDMKGFSYTNLKYCKQFFSYFQINQQPVDQISPQSGGEIQSDENKMIAIGPQSGGQFEPQFGEKMKSLVFNVPWSHIKIIIGKVKDIKTALFYFLETQKNGWSRDVLALQIKSNLHLRQGKSVNNFAATLPQPFSDLAQQTLKDPFVFDFITMAQPFHEKDIEDQLINHITKFILELGKGFAFVGRQYHLEIAESDHYIDMLFYHILLKCYVVIELKNKSFIPEYAGKLNFYLSAVDSLLKHDDDKPTIGILLCRDNNNVETEFSLRDINKPMGVSEFDFTNAIPDELRSSLPTIEEIEYEFEKLENEKMENI
jgi:predicted nuclease of restriction endonuclease-like (RecB) superfamily